MKEQQPRLSQAKQFLRRAAFETKAVFIEGGAFLWSGYVGGVAGMFAESAITHGQDFILGAVLGGATTGTYFFHEARRQLRKERQQRFFNEGPAAPSVPSPDSTPTRRS